VGGDQIQDFLEQRRAR